jgi:hypothetical protein
MPDDWYATARTLSQSNPALRILTRCVRDAPSNCQLLLFIRAGSNPCLRQGRPFWHADCIYLGIATLR